MVLTYMRTYILRYRERKFDARVKSDFTILRMMGEVRFYDTENDVVGAVVQGRIGHNLLSSCFSTSRWKFLFPSSSPSLHIGDLMACRVVSSIALLFSSFDNEVLLLKF
ncbi:hypothetical protein RHGRI_032056 [Rhododendron griersonianum]|uniref:Uncharacterized protein n=1 Tax=Rhododendron griersonianum TaxID=479676 RepID=A0AAV6IG13_9ERIC|nr:hypothetical protein RHGRI_032056 [Rhododendron griersonianum]